MNVQTEKLENHVVRLTVEIDLDQLEQAKRKSAKKIARQVNIPGFRKGKAPYRVLVTYLGEAPIVEDAVEELGNEIYKKALDEAEVEPYTSGSLEDFKLDPNPTFIFNVPMQPEVVMNDYLSVRVDYEPSEIKDEDVDEALKRLQEEHAVVEESAAAAKLGDRVLIDVHGVYADEDEASSDESDPEDDDSHEHEHNHDAPIHQHDAQIYLDVEREPLPGFADALVGVVVGEDREFELKYPDDADKYGDFSNRLVHFSINVKKIESVTLPELNDDFAERVTKEEDEPLTLLQLRARLRENLVTQLEEKYKSEYVEKVLDQLVEVADFAYPDAMVHNQIDSMIDNTARQIGLAREDYLRILQKSPESLYEDATYTDAARQYIERSLVMRGILDEEKIDVEDTDIDGEINTFITQFGEQADTYRTLFNTPEMRENMKGNLLEKKVTDRIVGIGRGEAVQIAPVSEEPSTEAGKIVDAEVADEVTEENDEIITDAQDDAELPATE